MNQEEWNAIKGRLVALANAKEDYRVARAEPQRFGLLVETRFGYMQDCRADLEQHAEDDMRALVDEVERVRSVVKTFAERLEYEGEPVAAMILRIALMSGKEEKGADEQ